MALDKETTKYLGEVKKGKPRNFVMICKGVKILSLIIYKKGTVEKYKKQAKQEGKGQFYHGVVDGTGININFKLLRSDGYDKPPGKELILKDFLKVNSDTKFKPTYEIVDELPEVPQDEDESSETPTESTTPPVETDNAAELFKKRFAALVPRIKDAAGTPVGDEAKLRASEAGALARTSDFVSANGMLDQIERMLNEAASGQESGQGDQAAQFKARLMALVPQIKQAVGTSEGDQAKQKAAAAGEKARLKDFEQANARLDEAEKLLKNRTSGGAVSFAKSRLQWQAAKKDVSGQIDRLRAAIIADAQEEEEEDTDAMEGAKKLESLIGRFNEGLSDSLDDLYNAENHQKPGLAESTLTIVGSYLDFVQSHALVSHIDENPYETVTVRSTLQTPLLEIQAQLKSIAS